MDLETLRERVERHLIGRCPSVYVREFCLLYVLLAKEFFHEVDESYGKYLDAREKQLRGLSYDGEGFESIKQALRGRVEKHLANGSSDAREALIFRLLFSAFIDEAESDSFYYVEPIFELVQATGYSADRLADILEECLPGLFTAQ